ncbi:baseplate J/gp47 family protein [bacterium]|nr:baseplate J/gp47 family protein [bacterium]
MFNPFKKKTTQTITETAPKRFFSVSMSERLVQAALWSCDQQVSVMAKSEPKPFFNDNDLLVKLDQCLQELGPEGETVHQTLFHLDSSYITGSEIDVDKKELFSKLTQAIQLESLGFVTNVESVVNAKLELNPQLQKQLIVEFVSDRILYYLYDGTTLLENLELSASEDFVTHFQGVLVQLASKIGVDYTPFFEADPQTAPIDTANEPLFVNFVSSLITSEEIATKVNQLPSNLPLRSEILGSESLLAYILIPSSTLIARSYGWLPTLEPESVPEPATSASTPPAEPVATDPMPVLSRQKNFAVPTVENNEFVHPEPQTPKQPMSNRTKKIIIIVCVVLLVLLLSILGFWWWLSQTSATVVLTPKSNTLTKSLEVTIDPTAKTADYDALILPGSIETKEISTDFEYTTTGKNNVGEPARGKVKIRNKQLKEVSLNKGLVIENGTVSYTLNDGITVPAAQEEGDGRKYGEKEVDVTAVTIGSAGNIGKDVSLRVGSAVKEDLEAVTMENFSGGTDKTIRVFSAEDQKAALTLAQDELADVAPEQVGTKRDDTYLVGQYDQLKVTAYDFDTKVDEEAETVLVSVTGTVPVIAYQLDELGPLAVATLQKDLPEGYAFVGSEPTMLSGVNERKTAQSNGEIFIDVDLSQEIISQVDGESIKNEILGQNLTKVAHYLSGLSELKQYEINWSNNIAANLTKKLPSKSDKLIVTVN